MSCKGQSLQDSLLVIERVGKKHIGGFALKAHGIMDAWTARAVDREDKARAYQLTVQDVILGNIA